jgi:hypothetical protein
VVGAEDALADGEGALEEGTGGSGVALGREQEVRTASAGTCGGEGFLFDGRGDTVMA